MLIWSTKPPQEAGLWLRSNMGHISRHDIIEADGKILAKLAKGLYISWANRLRNVNELPPFYWYGPIPVPPECS